MTVDSNIVIAYLDDDEVVKQILSDWKQQGRIVFLPTVVEAEVLSFGRWSDNERVLVEKFLSENFVTISFDQTLARVAASIRQKTKIKLPDAIIAATALFTDTSLFTRNTRDFIKIPNLRLYQI